MKKMIAISSILLGLGLLTGCGQKPETQTQSVMPVVQKPVAQNQPVQKVKTSQELMRDVLVKNNPDILNGTVYGPDSYKIFKEVKSSDSEKTAVLFGLDMEKTGECCSQPTGIFINSQGDLGAGYDILQGALQHLYLDNVRWQDDKTVLYDFVVSDEGGKKVTQKTIILK